MHPVTALFSSLPAFLVEAVLSAPVGTSPAALTGRLRAAPTSLLAHAIFLPIRSLFP